MPRIVLPGEPLVDAPTALRPWRDTDIPSLVEICQDPEIPRCTGPEAGVAAPFAIVSADDDQELLGSITLMRINWEHGRGEVGYWVAARARAAGHATRAVRLICAWGFSSLGLERIELLAATGNPASQRVAERAGFTREAVLRSFWVGRDGRHDMVCFSLLAGD
jgi:RimJ/RimL family protein N-acetyltransferase